LNFDHLKGSISCITWPYSENLTVTKLLVLGISFCFLYIRGKKWEIN